MKTITYHPETHKLVPLEPTEEMLKALTRTASLEASWASAYKAMLNAAPAASGSVEEAPGQDLNEIEQYRMQMAGICNAALGYWKEGDGIHPDYDTPALRDVARLYAQYAELYAKQQPATHGEPVNTNALAIHKIIQERNDALNLVRKLEEIIADKEYGDKTETIDFFAPNLGKTIQVPVPNPATQGEPVSHEFQGRDGKWYPFIDERHYENTVADGSWPIRELFTSPQPTPDHIKAMQQALEALEIATTPLAKDRQEVLRAIKSLQNALKGTT